MRQLFRPMLLLTLVLLVPITPFLLFGDQLGGWFESHLEQHNTPATIFWLVSGILATDIFLPIPSSAVSTFGGAQLGAVLGTFASWLGMSFGAAVGFVSARRWGEPLARRFSNPHDLDSLHLLSERHGPMIVILCRAVPVLAEASVLILGVHRLSWRRFVPAMLLANLGVALAYSALGELAREQKWLPAALAISVALPLLLTAVARKMLPSNRGSE